MAFISYANCSRDTYRYLVILIGKFISVCRATEEMKDNANADNPSKRRDGNRETLWKS